MRKKSMIAIAVGVVLVLLLGGALLLLNQPAAQQQSAVEEGSLLVYTTESTLTQFVSHAAGGGFTLQVSHSLEEEGAYLYAIDSFSVAVPLNRGVLAAMVSGAGELAASLRIPEPENLDQYGLNNPVRVELFFEDGTSTMLLMGGSSAEAGTVYLQASGDNLCGSPGDVYAVKLSSLERYLSKPLDLIHPTVTQVSTSGKLFATLRLSGTAWQQPVSFQVEAAGEDRWRYWITDPLEWQVGSPEGMSALQSLFGLIATRAVAASDNAEDLLARYFPEPYAVAQVTGTAEGDFVLCASAPDQNGNLLLMRQGVPAVYELPAEMVPWVGAQIGALARSVIFEGNIAELAELRVRAGNLLYEFVLEGEGDALSVTLDGTALELADFQPLYALLTGARLDSYVASAPRLQEPARMEVTAVYRDSAETRLTLYAGESAGLYAALDDAAVWTMPASFAVQVEEYLKNLVNQYS